MGVAINNVSLFNVSNIILKTQNEGESRTYKGLYGLFLVIHLSYHWLYSTPSVYMYRPQESLIEIHKVLD